MRTIVFCAIAIAVARVAAAEPENQLSIGGTARALRTPSANALTADDLGGVAFGYARALVAAPQARLAVLAELDATTASADGIIFQSLTTRLATVEITGGVRVRYQLHPHVALGARAAIGAQRARVELSGDGASASDHAWGAIATVGAAVDLLALARPPFGVGLRIDAGYTLARALSLTPHRAGADDTLMLPITDLRLGKLDLSGPTVAVSLLAQF